jgi:hypothetical protein
MHAPPIWKASKAVTPGRRGGRDWPAIIAPSRAPAPAAATIRPYPPTPERSGPWASVGSATLATPSEPRLIVMVSSKMT